MEDFDFSIDKNDIATLCWDVKESKMNVLSLKGIDELENKIDQIVSNPRIKGVIFSSRKRDFSGGADLKMLNKLSQSDEKRSNEKTFNQILRIHKILRKLEITGNNIHLKNDIKPVVWVCNGISAGIGTEIGLACHHRIVTNNSRTKIGLPEILVGLFPFGGGTTRVSRMLGLMSSAPILLEGKMLKPEKAKSLGIIDEIYKEKDIYDKAVKWILSANKEDLIKPWDKKNYKMPGGTPYHPSGFMTFVGASAMIMAKSKGVYPAPKVLLSSIYEGSLVPFETALKIEARWATYLLNMKSTKNMIRSLFVSKNELESGAVRPQEEKKFEIQEIAVIGAGMMGAGIAHVSALSGVRVILFDKNLDIASDAKNKIEEKFKRDFYNKKIDEKKLNHALSLITPSNEYKSLKSADLVIEAVFENKEIKSDVIKKVKEHLKKDAILASNTSTLPITDLSNFSDKPKRFIGIHFFSPVDKMKLVEIIRGKNTDNYSVAMAMDFCKIIKKTPIVVNDERFFYANRCIIPYVNEGVRMVGEGINPSLIENAAKQIGMPLGPLQLIDETSIQLADQIAKETKKALGENYKISIFDDVLQFMIQSKRFGRKSGAGFYDYNEKGRRIGIWKKLNKKWENKKENISFEEIKERLALIQALEATRALEKNILVDIREGDVGAILGWGCLPWAGGPFSWMDLVGIDEIIKKCEFFSERFGIRFTPPLLLKKLSDLKMGFYDFYFDKN